MDDIPTYIMTRRVTAINNITMKVNLGGNDIPFEPGMDVDFKISYPDGSVVKSGVRRIVKSGSSKAVSIPKAWGFKRGDLVYVTFKPVESGEADDA